MDNLARDMIWAKELGYGVHYGRYKADHPNTSGMKVKSSPEEADDTRVCKNCGNTFHLNGRSASALYCDDFCYRQMNARRAKQRAREKSGITDDELRVCPNCGKEFRLNGRHASCKYCSDACNPRAKYGRRRANG